MPSTNRFPLAFAGAMAVATVASVMSVWPAIIAMSAPSDEQVKAQILRIISTDPAFASPQPTKAPDTGPVLKVVQKVLSGAPGVIAVEGSPNGKAVVEFFDYNCGYCRRFTMGVVEPLVQEGSIRIHFVHAPILGPGSRRMAEFAAAAMLQGRFAPAHAYLSRQQAAKLEDAEALRPGLVKEAGLDKAKFDADMSNGSADRVVKENERLSAQAEVNGTPVIYVNGAVSRGALTMDQVRAALNAQPET